MNRDVSRLIRVGSIVGLPDDHLFNRIIDIALGDSVEEVMKSVPPDYLARFRPWIDRMLPSLDRLINLKTGPLSEHEKATIRAIAEWLDRHPAEERPYGEETGASANGLNAEGPLQPISDSGSPTV
jgi:hypothetical protein